MELRATRLYEQAAEIHAKLAANAQRHGQMSPAEVKTLASEAAELTKEANGIDILAKSLIVRDPIKNRGFFHGPVTLSYMGSSYTVAIQAAGTYELACERAKNALAKHVNRIY